MTATNSEDLVSGADRKPAAPRPVSDPLARAAPVWSGPIPHASSTPPRLWLLGATGGAGVTTLERVLGFAADCGRRWPGADTGQSTNVAIVSRETAGGLRAAHRLLEQHAAGDTGGAVLVGLITVAHSPEPMTEGIARLRAEVAAAAPANWRIGWHGRWPEVQMVNLPVWGRTGHEAAGTIGELPDDVVAVAVDLAGRVAGTVAAVKSPAEEAPAKAVSTEESSAEEVRAAVEAPAEEVPVEELSTEEAHAEEEPAEVASAEESPAEKVSAKVASAGIASAGVVSAGAVAAGVVAAGDKSGEDEPAGDESAEDASTQDAGAQDAGDQDTEVQDAGFQDAGAQDAETQGAGAQDTETQDGEAEDTEGPEAGAEKAGATDTSDADVDADASDGEAAAEAPSGSDAAGPKTVVMAGSTDAEPAAVDGDRSESDKQESDKPEAVDEPDAEDAPETGDESGTPDVPESSDVLETPDEPIDRAGGGGAETLQDGDRRDRGDTGRGPAGRDRRDVGRRGLRSVLQRSGRGIGRGGIVIAGGHRGPTGRVLRRGFRPGSGLVSGVVTGVPRRAGAVRRY